MEDTIENCKILLATENKAVEEKISEHLRVIGPHDLKVCSWEHLVEECTSTDLDMVLADSTDKSRDEIRAIIAILNRIQVQPVFFYFANPNTTEEKGYCFFMQELDANAIKRFLFFSKQLNFSPSNLGTGEMFASEPKNLLVRDKKEYLNIELARVFYITSDGNYCSIVTAEKNHLVNVSLRNIAAQLPQYQFVRIHKKYLINLQMLEKLDVSNNKAYYRCGKEFPIGRSFKKDLLEKFTIV